MQGGILALDLGTRTGWAVCDADARPVVRPLEGPAREEPRKYGVWQLSKKGKPWGHTGLAFQDLCRYAIGIYRPHLIIFEAPVLRHKGSAAGRILEGLAWQTETMAYGCTIECRDAHLATVKKHATGYGNATKEMMIAAARGHGWDVTEHDQADALWLLDFALACEAAQAQRGARAS